MRDRRGAGQRNWQHCSHVYPSITCVANRMPSSRHWRVELVDCTDNLNTLPDIISTMAKHNIKEAARLAGVNRTTLYTYMKEGRISWETLPNGNRVIDTAELSRVFGTLQLLNTDSMSQNEHDQHARTADSTREISLLQEQIEALRQHVQAAETDKADLRQRLDQAERRAERAEEERRQMTGLLEDLRPKPPAARERQRRWWFW